MIYGKTKQLTNMNESFCTLLWKNCCIKGCK